ncbi:MAG: patatin-like phospholipase family protein [Streptosporangiales bacterium]
MIGRGRPRTGLVLGAGGVLGAAWMTGALVRLQERLPLADVDLLVGTSAGSVLAAALRCRASLDEIVAWQRGDATGMLSESMVLAAQDGPLPPWPQLRPGSLPLARAALLLQVPPWVGASGWLPHGRGRHEALRSLVGALQKRHRPGYGSSDAGSWAGGSWADGRTWIVAMDYDSGYRVLFGHPGAPRASLADAVVASCSIPGWYEPARIGGRRYVDGGVRSATSLGVLAGSDMEEIYVLAPMASTEPDHPLQPHLRLERRVRQMFTRALLRQARALGTQGKRVTVVTPGPRDLAVMGANLMDPRRRRAVLEASLGSPALQAQVA